MGWFRAHNWLGAVATVADMRTCLSSVNRTTLPAGEEIASGPEPRPVGLLVLTASRAAVSPARNATPGDASGANHVATIVCGPRVGIVHTALNGPLAGR